MATTYKVLKTTHLRSQPSAKDKGSKISKGDVVVVTAKEVKPDGTWVQLEGGKWACAERGSDVLLKPITQISITVVQARDLLAKDSGGTSDPFFRICIEDNKKKHTKRVESEVIEKTLNPRYENTARNTFQLTFSDTDTYVYVECYDKDMLTRDLIGTVRIPVHQTNGTCNTGLAARLLHYARTTQLEYIGAYVLHIDGSNWYPLKTSSGSPAGEVFLHFGPDPPAPGDHHERAEPSATTAEESGGEDGDDADEKETPIATTTPSDEHDDKSRSVGSRPQSEARTEESIGSPRHSIEEESGDGAGEEQPKKEGTENEGVEEDGDDESQGTAETTGDDLPVPEQLEESDSGRPSEEVDRKMVTSFDVTVHSGRNLAVKDSGGKNDPYCVLALEDAKGKSLGGEEKTEVLKDCEVPVWNQTLTLIPKAYATNRRNHANAVRLRVELYDKDLIGKNLIGRTTIPIEQVLSAGQSEWFPIQKKGRDSGDVCLSFALGTGADTPSKKKAGMFGTLRGAAGKGVGAFSSGVKAGAKGVSNVAGAGAKGVSSVAGAGAKGVTTVAGAGARGVSTVAGAGAKGVSTVASTGVKGVTTVGGVATSGVKGAVNGASTVTKGVGGVAVKGVKGVTNVAVGGVTGVASAGMAGVKGVTNTVKGVAGFDGEGSEFSSLDVSEASIRKMRKKRQEEKLKAGPFAELKEFFTTLTPYEMNVFKALGIFIFIYFLTKFSFDVSMSLTVWLFSYLMGYSE